VQDNSVSVVDTALQKTIETIAVGEWPYCATLSHDDNTLYVTNQDENSVSKIDLRRNEVTAVIDVDDTPEGIDISANGRYLYVANWGSGQVSVIDTRTDKLIANIATAQGSRAFGDFIAGP
jgi:YVTN family beta-propeller protein